MNFDRLCATGVQECPALVLAEIIRALDGPLASVRGTRPEELEYTGRAAPLRDVWVAVRGSVRSVLEETTLADLLSGELPAPVRALAGSPEAWEPH